MGIVLALLLLTVSVGAEELVEPIPIAERTISFVVDQDGCEITNDLENPRVLNPSECPDKQFVKYLNCVDLEFVNPEDHPEECK